MNKVSCRAFAGSYVLVIFFIDIRVLNKLKITFSRDEIVLLNILKI